MNKIKQYLRRLIKIIKKTEMEILPANIAFNLILAIVPLLTIIVLIASSFDISISMVVNLLRKFMPNQVSDVLINVVAGKGFDSSVGIFNILAFVWASNGMYALITAADTVYHVKNSNYIKKRVSSIILLMIVITLLIFLLVVPIFGDSIISLLTKAKILENHSKELIGIFNIFKWPLTLLIIYFNIKLIYVIAPSENIKSVDTTVGSIFTTVIWLIATVVFKFYLAYFARYDILYGNLASIIIMMIWLYFISYIFVLGMAINVSYYVEREND